MSTKADWLPLKSIVVMLAIQAGMLAGLAGLVAAGQTEFVVPPPEQEAAQFFKALKAHNYESARDKLSEPVRARVDAARLKAAVESLESEVGGLRKVEEVGAQERGAAAQAEVSLTLGNGQTVSLKLPMRQEHGIWKIESIDPLTALVDRLR